MHRWWIDRWRLLFSRKLSLIYLSLLCVWTHQCSFHRCGPVRNHHRTRSGTSLEGSGKFQTHRCSGNYTHRCLGRERQNVRYTSLNENKKSRNETRESLNVTERVRHLDRPCCLLWEWSPSHTRSGSHPERSDTGRSRTGSRCLRTHPCLKQNRPVSHKAHCTGIQLGFIWKVSSLTGAGKSVSIEALLACTPVGSRCVDTVCVGIAVVVLCGALILI